MIVQWSKWSSTSPRFPGLFVFSYYSYITATWKHQDKSGANTVGVVKSVRGLRTIHFKPNDFNGLSFSLSEWTAEL